MSNNDITNKTDVVDTDAVSEMSNIPENDDREIKVSVIVPIYNACKYIRPALDSIISQTLAEIEIICVDDCGQDDSMQIVKNLAKEDSRIKIIKHRKNKGLGGARNSGLKKATGDYVFFVDSDDWLEESCVQKVVNKFEDTNLDTIWFKPSVYWEETQQVTDMSPMFPYYAKCKGGYEILNEKTLINYPLYSWNKAYNREFLLKNKLKWRENIYFEDVEFYFKTFIKSPEIYIINENLYNYRRRNDSIVGSSTRDYEKAKQLYFVTKEVYKYLKKEGLFEKYKNIYARYVYDAITMFRSYPKTYKKLMSIMLNFLKEINYPNSYI